MVGEEERIFNNPWFFASSFLCKRHDYKILSARTHSCTLKHFEQFFPKTLSPNPNPTEIPYPNPNQTEISLPKPYPNWNIPTLTLTKLEYPFPNPNQTEISLT